MMSISRFRDVARSENLGVPVVMLGPKIGGGTKIWGGGAYTPPASPLPTSLRLVRKFKRLPSWFLLICYINYSSPKCEIFFSYLIGQNNYILKQNTKFSFFHSKFMTWFLKELLGACLHQPVRCC